MMKDYKKIACIVLSGAMMISLVACGSSSSKKTAIEAVDADAIKNAYEEIGLEELTWDDYWWDNGTFYIEEDGSKADGTGAEGNNYTWAWYEDEEEARTAYESAVTYLKPYEDEFDCEVVEEDDYSYFTANFEDEYIGYYYAGNCTLVVEVNEGGLDEANEFLSSIGYPEF